MAVWNYPLLAWMACPIHLWGRHWDADSWAYFQAWIEIAQKGE